MLNSININTIILSAGQSARFGEPKYRLKFDSNRTFIEKIIAEYLAFGCEKIVVVTNSQSFSKILSLEIVQQNHIEVVINPTPEKGRFSSIKTGFSAIQIACPTFIQNIDNPFISKSLLQLMAHDLENHDGICPAYHGKGGHPLLLSEKLIKNLITKETNFDFKVFLKGFDIQKVEVSKPEIVANINTIQDYIQWFG